MSLVWTPRETYRTLCLTCPPSPGSRISQTRTYTRNVGVNMYTNVKNFTWDKDGQLAGVAAQEPWSFEYDPNGNMLSLTYRGNTIPMEYNQMDRVVKFGEGQYRYDSRGLVVQNAREERFHYNAKGLLVSRPRASGG